MLCELRINNLALIESLALTFEAGGDINLVVMTGETGAGKSIMLRAIQLLSGQRASTDWIRSGEEFCAVEALFEIKFNHVNLLEKLDAGGFGKETTVVIKRQINSKGRSRYYVNGSIATGKIVSELTSELFNIAGQHDQQRLLLASTHLDYLDTIGDHWSTRLRYKKLFEQWQQKSTLLGEMRLREQEKEQRQDFLKFQVSEIREAATVVGEDEELLLEKKKLKNSQTLIELSQASYRLLSGEINDSLSQLRNTVTQLAAIDPEISKLAENISGYTFTAEDYIAELRAYKDSIDTDPFRLDQINERLDALSQLKRKYGETIVQILEFAEQAEAELGQLENMDKEIGLLADEVQQLEQNTLDLAGQLSEKRQQTASDLEQLMETELSTLAFERPSFKVQWKEVINSPASLSPIGLDKGEFFFSANPGEAMKPLVKVASGGELSRLMLAMKCLLARKDMVETVVFDEVDAGIGGEAAEAVARKIQELAGHHQVFCITHLPQIAARGAMHFQVAKIVENGRTQTRVKELSSDNRIEELVRMLAGDSATEQTEAWALDLLAKGKGGVYA